MQSTRIAVPSIIMVCEKILMDRFIQQDLVNKANINRLSFSQRNKAVEAFY